MNDKQNAGETCMNKANEGLANRRKQPERYVQRVVKLVKTIV
jgi:hypothetical protein